MEDKELKTSPRQRFIIIAIAVIMLGSIIASYAAIIMNGSKAGNNSTSDTSISDAKKQQYTEEYYEETAKFSEATKSDFDKFIAYKSEIKAFNEESANENELVQIKELVAGDGEEVKLDGSNYLAYYVGYCADESIFDSTLDDKDNPTGFSKVLDPSLGMIEGWNQGVNGMKVGGVRRITIPGKLAYGDSMEICGGKNKPLRFLLMAVKNDEELLEMSKKVDDAYMKYQYAQMGMDYDKLMTSSAASSAGAGSEAGGATENEEPVETK